MESKITDLTESEARLLMSCLMDGELPADDADRLFQFLEANPDAIDWMESNQAIADSNSGTEYVVSHTSWGKIQTAISEDTGGKGASSKLILFPPLFRVLGIAAAIALVASIVWKNLPSTQKEVTERYAASQSVVEFVDTDIPDVSPVVYTDEISGWTVVWVAEMDPIGDETG